MKNLKFPLLLLTVLASLSISSCKKGSLPPPPSQPDFWFYGKLDGTTVKMTDQGTSFSSAAGFSTSDDSTGTFYFESSSLMTELFGSETAGWSLVGSSLTLPDISQQAALFDVKSYDWGKFPLGFNDQGIEGVVIFYSDGLGTEWRSDNGAQGSGSFFRITEIEDESGSFSEKVATAEFECTLYDSDGNSKAFKSGESRTRIISTY